MRLGVNNFALSNDKDSHDKENWVYHDKDSHDDSSTSTHSQVKNLHFFELNSEALQEMLLPSPTRCLEIMNAYVPKLAVEKQRLISEELMIANEK
jgi:hypothetical protein